LKKIFIIFFFSFLFVSNLYGFADNFKVMSSSSAKALWDILVIIAKTMGVIIFFHAIYKIFIEEDPQSRNSLASNVLYLILGLILVTAGSW